jgi:hypothetical protein
MLTVGNVTSLHRILKFQGWPVPSEVAESAEGLIQTGFNEV